MSPEILLEIKNSLKKARKYAKMSEEYLAIVFSTIEENTSVILEDHGYEPINKLLDSLLSPKKSLDEAIQEFVGYGDYGLNEIMEEIQKLPPREQGE
jgi:hypothetical protein